MFFFSFNGLQGCLDTSFPLEEIPFFGCSFAKVVTVATGSDTFIFLVGLLLAADGVDRFLNFLSSKDISHSKSSILDSIS